MHKYFFFGIYLQCAKGEEKIKFMKGKILPWPSGKYQKIHTYKANYVNCKTV